MIGKLDTLPQLTGKLTKKSCLTGKISKVEGLSGKLVSAGNIPAYKGDYLIVPSTENDIILETKQKVCTSDITLTKVPFRETPNASEGETVYIGKEIEIHGV